MGDAVGVLAGQRWTIIRKHFDPEFSFKASRQSIPLFTKRISDWTEQLFTLVPDKEGRDSGCVLDITKPSKFLTFELVAYQLYGATFSEEVCLAHDTRQCTQPLAASKTKLNKIVAVSRIARNQHLT